MLKKSGKLVKIVKIDQENLIKIHRKTELYSISRKYIFENATGERVKLSHPYCFKVNEKFF